MPPDRPALPVLSPAPTEARGTSPRARLRRSLFRILDALDEQRPVGIVRICAAGEEVGRILVSGGRICMAFAAPGEPEARGPGAEQLRALATAALAGGQSLGSAILGSGREAALRAALLDEAASGLLSIVRACADRAPTLDVVAARDDYEPRLALGTAEVFVAALGRLSSGPVAMPETSGGVQAALLLCPEEPGELPYPVAQHGLDSVGVREVVALVRLASSLGRPGASSPSAGGWQCLAGSSALLLVKAQPEAAAELAAWAHLLVGGRRRSPAPAVALEIPKGLIWPPIEGRTMVREAAADQPAAELLPDGTWVEVRGRWRLHSSGTDVYPSVELARPALLAWARRWAQEGVSQPRCVFAALASDGAWRLVQMRRED